MKAWSCLFSYVTMPDNATCREIEVVAKDGNQAISLGSNERGNGVIVYDNQGKAAISLASAEGANLLGVMANQGKRSLCTVV